MLELFLRICSFIYLENINLILAFIINIISQPIEHLNVALAFIVCSDTEMHVILYSTVNVYTAIMINCPIGYLSGSVDRTREYSVGSHVVSVRIHCTEKWRTSFHTDVLSKSK